MIAGAKNAALPIMAASLLTDEPLSLSNIPHLTDINTMANLLIQHGVSFSIDGSNDVVGKYGGRVIQLTAKKITSHEAPYDIVRKMRASVWVLGPLLARTGKAKVSLPGGCAIGTRPIDMHLRALEQMGAKIELADGYVAASCRGRLKGAEIQFEAVSVGATVNALMAATLAKGTSVITNAAKEPEITDLANCLSAMGAKIDGIGTSTLTIEGQERLHGASHQIIADRIEAATFATAAIITNGQLELVGTNPSVLGTVFEKFEEAGASINMKENSIVVKQSKQGIKSVDVTTQPYPGFPTDMQAQIMALMSIASGASIITETIFENRFMHVPELSRMGANITVHGNTATIRGVDSLKGAPIMATDLRASVSLVLAGLAAEGETIINRVYHIDRGYEWIEDKLRACNANIQRIRD